MLNATAMSEASLVIAVLEIVWINTVLKAAVYALGCVRPEAHGLSWCIIYNIYIHETSNYFPFSRNTGVQEIVGPWSNGQPFANAIQGCLWLTRVVSSQCQEMGVFEGRHSFLSSLWRSVAAVPMGLGPCRSRSQCRIPSNSHLLCGRVSSSFVLSFYSSCKRLFEEHEGTGVDSKEVSRFGHLVRATTDVSRCCCALSLVSTAGANLLLKVNPPSKPWRA